MICFGKGIVSRGRCSSFPSVVSSFEKAADGEFARGSFERGVCMGVREIVRLPGWFSWWPILLVHAFAKQEVVSVVSEITKRADGDREELHGLGVELLNGVDAGATGTATALLLCCIFVPGESGNRFMLGDTRRKQGRGDHGDVHAEVLGWVWARFQ